MSNNNSVQLIATLVAALIAQTVSAPQAAAGKFLNQTGCSQCCPECKHVCKLDVEKIEEEKKCFEVEEEVICIPRVVFPWQRKSVRRTCDSCDSCGGNGCSTCCHKGAKTRKVKILTTRKYKCPKCEYTWSAEKKPCAPCGGSSCDTGCDRPAYSGAEYAQPPFPAGVSMELPAPLPSNGDAEPSNGDAEPSYGEAESTGLKIIEVQHQ